ncbi:hypothetical protein [Rhodococcus ruber]|uniref:hypothetical protein n=1 Tax=Rhodococcus ruber TaxID=1830 RepID=UPI001F45B341|nr:hypothetical protein [Rhodococcus ruber]MCF8786243.1 hypothetical protein [Rhodococcus ruber]
MTAPTATVSYTEESRRLFLRSVANKVDEVANAASAGPWLLSQTINDAIQVRPAPDHSERHLCGLIDPNDARAAVAADPENLRSLANVMREAATNTTTPSVIIDALCDVAQRWDTAMLLRCSGVLQVVPDHAATAPSNGTSRTSTPAGAERRTHAGETTEPATPPQKDKADSGPASASSAGSTAEMSSADSVWT